jgi:hypothetical protein
MALIRGFVVILPLLALTTFRDCDGGSKGMKATNVQDSIGVSGGGNCVQTVGGKATTYVYVDHDAGTVTWVMPNVNDTCAIHFGNNSASCPFYVAGQNYCDYSCNGGQAVSHPATGPKDLYSPYPYGSISINNVPCSVGSDGIVLDH